MFEQDKATVLTALRDRFSKATDADGEDLWDAVKGEHLDDVIAGIKEHRGEKGSQAYRPDIRRVGSIAKARRSKRSSGNIEGRVVGFIRRTNPDCQGMDEVSAITLHYGNAWDRVKSEQHGEHATNLVRAMIYRDAFKAFGEARYENGVRISLPEADAMARDIVGAAPGEKILKPMSRGGEVFKRAIGPDTVDLSPAKSFPALKQLAIHEHAGVA